MVGPIIDHLAHGFGMTDFRWAGQGGVARFNFERRGTLYLEERGENLLMYLSRAFDKREQGRKHLILALRLCHYQHAWPCSVQVGLHNESQLVLLARLPVSEVTLPVLEQTLELLTRLHDRIDQAR